MIFTIHFSSGFDLLRLLSERAIVFSWGSDTLSLEVIAIVCDFEVILKWRSDNFGTEKWEVAESLCR